MSILPTVLCRTKLQSLSKKSKYFFLEITIGFGEQILEKNTGLFFGKNQIYCEQFLENQEYWEPFLENQEYWGANFGKIKNIGSNFWKN